MNNFDILIESIVVLVLALAWYFIVVGVFCL